MDVSRIRIALVVAFSLVSLAACQPQQPPAPPVPTTELLAVDTPWSGFCAPRIDLRNLWRRPRAWVDMVSNSTVLTRLHTVALPAHFRVHHLEADQRPLRPAALLTRDLRRAWNPA